MTKPKKPESWRKALPKRVAELQRTMQKRVRKGLEGAVELLPPAPRKAVKRLTASVERTGEEWRKRGDKMVTDARKRAERFGGEVQKRVEKAIEPVTRRLDVASRADVERLQRRLHEIERRMEAHRPHVGTPA